MLWAELMKSQVGILSVATVGGAFLVVVFVIGYAVYKSRQS